MTARSPGYGSGSLAGALHGRPALPAARPARAQPTPRIGIGELLREARVARALTYAEAERDTHIPRHHLQALEEERFDAFSARVYVRGFLRSYAQYLGLDAVELVALLPPDRPVEEERLLPLSRLGHPRGPQEAERARGHPIERDAPPLTEATLTAAVPPVVESEQEQPRVRARDAFRAAPVSSPQQRPRIDPLGRLGWPAGPSDRTPVRSDPLEPSDEPVPERVTDPSPGAVLRERPAAARRRSGRPSLGPIRDALPEDVRPLFSRRVLPGAFALIAALVVFYVLALSIGGGDTSPTVLASAATGSVSNVAAPVPSSPSVARGAMPDLHGRDLPSAEAALLQVGITPVVVEQGSSGGLSGQVIAQAPAPGVAVRSDTPVTLVAGQP